MYLNCQNEKSVLVECKKAGTVCKYYIKKYLFTLIKYCPVFFVFLLGTTINCFITIENLKITLTAFIKISFSLHSLLHYVFILLNKTIEFVLF